VQQTCVAFLQGITILLTANGVSFNWNKHNVMERVRWLPVSLRAGMASWFLHGWKVGERREKCKRKLQEEKWPRIKN